MKGGLKGIIGGTLAVAGVATTSVETQAMPVQNLGDAAVTSGGVEKVWYRWGWRRPFYGYGYGWRRPFYGYGWGWRRPIYGYGYGWHRPWGWRRW